MQRQPLFYLGLIWNAVPLFFSHTLYCNITFSHLLMSLIVPKSLDSAVTPQPFLKLRTKKCTSPSSSPPPPPHHRVRCPWQETLIWKTLRGAQLFSNTDLWTKLSCIPGEVTYTRTIQRAVCNGKRIPRRTLTSRPLYFLFSNIPLCNSVKIDGG